MTDITANSEIKSLGQVAFEAYRAEVVTAFNGDPIPEWDKLDNGAPARRGWEAAARAIREHTQMMNALDASAIPAHVVDFRTEQRSRWRPVPSVRALPDDYSTTPGSRGDTPTGETVPVDVEPDDEPREVGCSDPKCTIDHEARFGPDYD
jgi:hypothetical protein